MKIRELNEVIVGLKGEIDVRGAELNRLMLENDGLN